MKKFQLEFAPIDTTDNHYRTISCGCSFHSEPATEHNITVLEKAEKEYLEKLLELQNEIKEKYQLQEESEDLDCDRDLEDKISTKVWKGVDKSKYNGLYYS